ncbi:hypothetical protein [Salinithrix halophila]|uniref:Uncharacterized protein n=1 Tax=Salinithrix halophila TaxID=1485204 RepID=A0ABV8JGE1_9BACL
MRLEINLSWEELNTALSYLERRCLELKRKIAEGDRKGRSIERYRNEAIHLDRVLEEIRSQMDQSRESSSIDGSP